MLGLIVFLRLVVAGWWFWFCRFWFGFSLRFVGYLFCGCYAVSHVRLAWLLDGDSCEAGGFCVVQVDSGFLGFVVGAWCWFSWLGRFLALGGVGGLVFLRLVVLGFSWALFSCGWYGQFLVDAFLFSRCLCWWLWVFCYCFGWGGMVLVNAGLVVWWFCYWFIRWCGVSCYWSFWVGFVCLGFVCFCGFAVVGVVSRAGCVVVCGTCGSKALGLGGFEWFLLNLDICLACCDGCGVGVI